MLTGTALGQLIVIAVIPLMSRLFTPSDLAAYAVILALSGFTAVGASLRYELSIILPYENSKAKKLTIFTIQSVFITTFILMIILNFIYPWLLKFEYFSKYPQISVLLLFWPFFHYLIGINSVGNYLLTRQGNFKRLATGQIGRSLTTAFSIIATGLAQKGSGGLIISSILGQFVFALIVWQPNKNYFKRLLSKPDRVILKKYNNFPLYSLPMSVLNVFSIDMLLHAMNFFTTSLFTGLYAKAYRVINMPLSVLNLAFASVFFRKLNSSTNKIRIYNLAFLINLIIALLILSPLIFWGEELFAFILGEQWRESGRIAKLLVPLSIFCYAAGSVSQVYDVLQKNQAELIWQIFYLIGGLCLIYFGSVHLKLDHFQLIKLFAFFGAIAYIFMYAVGLWFLTKSGQRKTK